MAGANAILIPRRSSSHCIRFTSYLIFLISLPTFSIAKPSSTRNEELAMLQADEIPGPCALTKTKTSRLSTLPKPHSFQQRKPRNHLPHRKQHTWMNCSAPVSEQTTIPIDCSKTLPPANQTQHSRRALRVRLPKLNSKFNAKSNRRPRNCSSQGVLDGREIPRHEGRVVTDPVNMESSSEPSTVNWLGPNGGTTGHELAAETDEPTSNNRTQFSTSEPSTPSDQNVSGRTADGDYENGNSLDGSTATLTSVGTTGRILPEPVRGREVENEVRPNDMTTKTSLFQYSTTISSGHEPTNSEMSRMTTATSMATTNGGIFSGRINGRGLHPGKNTVSPIVVTTLAPLMLPKTTLSFKFMDIPTTELGVRPMVTEAKYPEWENSNEWSLPSERKRQSRYRNRRKETDVLYGPFRHPELDLKKRFHNYLRT